MVSLSEQTRTMLVIVVVVIVVVSAGSVLAHILAVLWSVVQIRENLSIPFPDCKECANDRAHQAKFPKDKPIWFVVGKRDAGKIGPLTQALMEEEFNKWKLSYAKRHGHPYPEIDFYGAADEEGVAWLRGT